MTSLTQTTSWSATVCDEVFQERIRQMQKEGWTPEHDNLHQDGQLSAAALCYVQNALCVTGNPRSALRGVPGFWPWEDAWWKPTTPRRDLIKAAALIVAEIERLDRQEQAHD